MGHFTKAEIQSEFERYLGRSAACDWAAWAEHFTEDAEYVEHEFGVMHGRDAIREWIVATMAPAVDMTFPVEWSVIDEDRDRVVFFSWNQFPALPGHQPADFQFGTISIIDYAGDGKWKRQEDIYNAKEADAALTRYLETAAAEGVDLGDMPSSSDDLPS